MRKFHKLATFVCLGLIVSSQTLNAQIANFENLTLPTESYWDGSDLSGTHNNGVFTSEFQSGDFIFTNEFDTTWGAPGYWLGGFAYSNTTDSVTSGAGNKYSAKAGSGANNSDNYAVASNNSSLAINGAYQILKFKITNSTYAYNSMRDGDMFAKKFGGATGDDPDWFKVNIKFYLSNNLEDSTDFYLADFRFNDNSQDYILKDWTSVNINPIMNTFDSVYFELSSSDVGNWGMNTPAFFCIDDVEVEMVVSVKEFKTNSFSFYPNPAFNFVNIKNETIINTVSVLDLNGKNVLTNSEINSNITSINISELNTGIYFIQLTDEKGLISTQKIVKH